MSLCQLLRYHTSFCQDLRYALLHWLFTGDGTSQAVAVSTADWEVRVFSTSVCVCLLQIVIKDGHLQQAVYGAD